MAVDRTGSLVRRVARLAAGRAGEGPPDRELLRAFAERNDQDAFAALVERHGGMVLRVCRRVLGQHQDAEDCLQAAFLVLARKADTVRRQEALASWLHGVAYRIAMSAKRDAGRRRGHERKAEARAAADPGDEVTWAEVRAVLDEEIPRLPAAWRAPFVLCCLEERSAADAARELGVTEAAVRGRLHQAKQRLRTRLAGRGLTLPAALLAVGLASEAGAAVPDALVRLTVQTVRQFTGGAGAASPGTASPVSADSSFAKAAAFAERAVRAMSAARVKLRALVLGAAGLVALGAGVLARPAPPAADPAPLPVAAAPAEPVKEPLPEKGALEEGKHSVTVRGRVLDADGKPFAGAEITLGWWYGIARDWFPPVVGAPLKPAAGAVSGKDGRFEFTLTKAEVFAGVDTPFAKPWERFQVVAAAKGHGPGFAWLQPGQAELTLRLARDDAPVKGRVLDLQGRPVAGAVVRVEYLAAGRDYLTVATWSGLPEAVTTGKDGRFVVPGLGRGRRAHLHVEGPTIEHRVVEADTPGPADDKPAAEVEVVAGPTKPVEGTVRAKDTGKPLAGVVVYGEYEAHRGAVRAVTDADGRYRLVGLAKAGDYRVELVPPPGLGYVEAVTKVADTEGLAPLKADCELRPGVRVRVRVIDKETRQPVRAAARYSPLFDNPLVKEARRPIASVAHAGLLLPDKDHAFEFVAYPGPGLVVVYGWVSERTYLPADLSFDPADEKKGYKVDGGRDPYSLQFLRLCQGYRILDPALGDKPMTVEIELNPGRTLQGRLTGPDGKPAAGATAFGLGYRDPQQPTDERPLTEASFTATGIHPKAPRTVSFVHTGRKLFGHVVLTGDEKEPLAVRLEPWAAASGRLVDAAGKPLAGVRVRWSCPALPAPGLSLRGEPAATDAEGRFRIDGLPPGVKVDLTLHAPDPRGKEVAIPAAPLAGLSIKAGEAKDLGDVRVKGPEVPAGGPKKENGNE